MIINIILLAILLVSSCYDIKFKEIPVWTIWLAGVVSVIYNAILIYKGHFDYNDLIVSLFPGALFLTIALICKGNLGIGDGAMLLAIAPGFGILHIYLGLMLALLLNSLVAIFLIIFKRAGKKTRMPFIPFLSIGIGGAIIVFG